MRKLLAGFALAGSLLALGACSERMLAGAGLSAGPADWAAHGSGQAWVNPPELILVMERRGRTHAEQKLALPNRTSLAGDNFIYLQTVSTPNPLGMRFEAALENIGGLPSPFTEADLGAMRAREDSAGSLAWAEWTSGAGTTCVLAMRRLTVENRALPERVTALDMVMRNCVPGSADDALAPADARHVAFPAPTGAWQGAQQRILSPLAAPM
ncbi:MAG: hypothetical protein JJU15_04930 [Pararhodobacter sp.]|nr:hypothetical protein [Pararhodobacter sp.]